MSLKAISRIIVAVIIVIILIVAGAAAYSLAVSKTSSSTTSSTSTPSSTVVQSSAVTSSSSVLSSSMSATSLAQSSTSAQPSSTSSSMTSSSSSTSTSTSSTIPSVLTDEAYQTPQYLEPAIDWDGYGQGILQNIYEPLIWYNGSSSSTVIPWLAQTYTSSPDLKTWNFTLRSGITFSDGEPLNSTAVYFSLNRVLMLDGSPPSGHGTQAAWIFQQLLNTSLSTTLCGCTETYNANYVNEVLNESFVQITGPLTFTIHVMNPNTAFPYLFANTWGQIMAPVNVMQHDLTLWNQSSNDYTLPYPTLRGNLTNQIREYFFDMAATCNAGATPKGCGATYFETSTQGSTAGTGPYILQSNSATTSDIVLTANPNYWGGPYQYLGGSKIVPQIKTIDINYVPQENTRLIDLENAAKSGQAMTVQITSDSLFDVADRNSWLSNGTLVSTIPGVTLYGPYNAYEVSWEQWATNVTDLNTGSYYQFQPFADYRLRLAFSDSVNMSAINEEVNNNLGIVANNGIVPGLPPAGSHSDSINPVYSYNLTAVQDLLLSAMEDPITHFTFYNGTAAPPGLFNNTFGCTTLNANGQCSNPVAQTVTMYYPTGDTVDQAVFIQIASAINNVSSTYNMGLTADVVPLPYGILFTDESSSYLYASALTWEPDYPWVVDFLGPAMAPGQFIDSVDHWNYTALIPYWNEVSQSNENGNVSGIITGSNGMNEVFNQEVLYLYTFYPLYFQPFTSNIHGYYFNPSLENGLTAVPEYFASLY